MHITVGVGGCTLYRDAGDPRISKESTVVYHMKRLLNSKDSGVGRGKFVRFYPSKEALTSCPSGIIDRKTGDTFWHERYAIELAHQEYNSGSVFFMRTNTKEDE